MGHKIALISDIHYGVKGNSETYLSIIEDFFLNTLSNVLKDREITDVRILGDLFDNRNTINIRTVNTVIKVFRWYQTNMPSVKWKILLGNHDIYYHNRLDINSIELIREFPNVTVISSVTEEKIDDYKIISFPWLVEGTEPDTKFKEIISSDKRYDLCLGHFEINGFEVVSGITHEGGVDSGKFKNFDRVISGHFHLRRTDGHISYLGCPYPLTWADYGDEKGIHIFDIETKQTEFIKNVNSPIFVRINIEDLLAKNKEQISLIKGNFVKLIIDKKYSDQIIVKALSVVESFKPRRLDVENNFIEEFDGSDAKDTDMSKLNDPLSFLSEYIKNIENTEVEIEDKNDFIKYVSSLYISLTKDKD
jgi:DNA repair exonuclease SbcCD nuclease subunit